MQQNPASPESGRDAALAKELAALKNEYERLREEKVRAEQNLANVTAQLAELEAKAVAEYGTSDLAELTGLLAARRQENERLLAVYREHIAAIRQGLDAAQAG